MTAKDIGIIILAAGESSRMGTAKQNLMYQNETLLERSIQAAQESEAATLVVVLGAFEKEIKQKDDVNYIINSNWQTGMGNSVRVGVQEILKKNPQLSGILLMLCDQPFVTSELLNQLIESFQNQTEKSIIACQYEGTMGVPVLFGTKWFDDLQRLNGKAGAQKVIRQNIEEVIPISFPQGKWDIDTPKLYQALLRDELEL